MNLMESLSVWENSRSTGSGTGLERGVSSVLYFHHGGSHQSTCADQGLFVKVKFGMMMSIVEMPLRVRRADEEITTGHHLLHERHILCAHRGVAGCIEIGFTEHT